MAAAAAAAIPYITDAIGVASIGADVYGAVHAGQAQSQTQNYMNQELGMQQQAQGSANSAIAKEQSAANPALNYGQQEIASAQSGQITPAQQQMVDQWTQQQQASVNQYLAGSGQENSSAAQQWQQYISQQAAIMKQNFVTQNGQTGLQATQVGLSGYGQSASAAAGMANSATQGVGLGAQASNAAGSALGSSIGNFGSAINSINTPTSFTAASAPSTSTNAFA